METILQHPRRRKMSASLLGRPRHERGPALDAREGRDPLCVHGEPRAARRADYDDIPRKARLYGAEQARLIDCRRPLVNEGLAVLQCGASTSPRRGRLLQHHADRPRVTGTMLVAAMKEDDVISGGWQHIHKATNANGFIATGCSRTRAQDLQAVARPGFIDELGGRAEMSEYLRQAGFEYHMKSEKAYSTDSKHARRHARGQDLEQLNPASGSSSRSWVGLLARRCARQARRGHGRFDEGQPVALNGMEYKDPVGCCSRRPDRRRHGLGMSDQSKTASSRPRAAHLRGAGMPCCSSPTSA